MLKWIVLSSAAVIMITVWTVFFSFLSDGDSTALPSEENYGEETENNRNATIQTDSSTADNESESSEEADEESLNGDEAEEGNIELPENEESVDVSEVIKGDALGYGEGISIDSLLESIMTDD